MSEIFFDSALGNSCLRFYRCARVVSTIKDIAIYEWTRPFVKLASVRRESGIFTSSIAIYDCL
jgi:hypothetical protein